MSAKELIKGKTYWININDCCVVGSFKGRFIGFMIYDDNNVVRSYNSWPEDAEEYGAEAHFDTGYVELRGATRFDEIPDAS